ncbi:MAG: carboxypeptidase-like regulatory domain-containing protein [Thermomonas sp.]
MNNSNSRVNKQAQRRSTSRIRNLAMAAVMAMCGSAASVAVHAQSTVGHIFGIAPTGDGIVASNAETGVQRRVYADAKGRYRISSLSAGVYTVTLEQNNQSVAKHLNVPVRVGGGIKVDFDCSKGECGEGANKP